MIEPLESRIAPASLVTITDADGDLVTVKVDGPGAANVTLNGGALNNADIDQIELVNTDLSSSLTVSVAITGPGNTTTVNRVVTQAAEQHLGKIDFFPNVRIGDGVADANPDVRITGKMKQLLVIEVQPNTIFRLGEGLPYDVAGETKTPDTYNNRPDVTFININGPGVELNLIGNGQPHGQGGGGLGKVQIGSWSYPGFIRTTQSIGSLTTLFPGDFEASLEVDKFGVGTHTRADVGVMKINGNWGSTGTEIEGDVKTFDVAEFKEHAVLSAGSVGKANIKGAFKGVINLTDPDSELFPTFTVNADFVGNVTSESPLQKLKIKGDFKGSLEAPSIGAITAYEFFGGTDMLGAPTSHIKAKDGYLGSITSTNGPVTNFEISSTTFFKGIKVNLAKLERDTAGVENVKISAASIGNILVSLKAAPKATGLKLVGINNSSFVTTAIGITKLTAGSIGKVAVAIGGALAGNSATGIADTTFDALVGDVAAPGSTANSLGDISVKIGGQGGAALGLSNVTFSANSIGKTKIDVSRGAQNGSTAQAINNADFSAIGAIGAMTVGGDATTAQVDGLKVWAGTLMGGLTVKSKDKVNGSLIKSSILAGQALKLDGTTAEEQMGRLALAKLGAVSVSGSLTETTIASGGSLDGVAVGQNMSKALVVAGALLGADRVFDGDETCHRAARIGGISVGGTFEQSSIAAGVDAGDGVFGNADDKTADAVNLISRTSVIGSVKLATGTMGAAPTGDHNFAIEAAAIEKLTIAGAPVTGLPLFLQTGGGAGEDLDDVVIRLL